MGRNLPAADTRPAWEAGHVAEHLQGVADSWIPKAAVEEVYSGDAGWMRAATPRRRDPAAMWLAEHHPDALDGFGPAV
jgi:hypothetical protein